MKKKSVTTSITELLSCFERIIKNKPALNRMCDEVLMMKFHVKPVKGDIAGLPLGKQKFIETLWSLGKVDELFQKKYRYLAKEDRETALRIFSKFHEDLQAELNRINFREDKQLPDKASFEIEIYKEFGADKKNFN
ncbi:hypothetical protein HY214_03800 [Candidatus Roizmanbacteria bacterium]|nr:hypothetical protein [Candidatus Roizmanbacteria bacterium]